MAKKPEPPKPIPWIVYKIANILVWLAEIGYPNRKLSFGGMQDVVCVRLNHGDGWPDFSVRRAYAFTHGRLDSGTGAFISGQGGFSLKRRSVVRTRTISHSLRPSFNRRRKHNKQVRGRSFE